MNNTVKLVIAIVVPQLLGGLGALVTVSSIGSWYQSIEKLLHPLLGFLDRRGRFCT